MALLEGLEVYGDKLSSKEVVEKIWPHLITGFGDLVPVIREATVKSILIIAPKVSCSSLSLSLFFPSRLEKLISNWSVFL